MTYETLEPPKKINVSGYIGWVRSLMPRFMWLALVVAIVAGIFMSFVGLVVGILLGVSTIFGIKYSSNKEAHKEIYAELTTYLKAWWNNKPEHKV